MQTIIQDTRAIAAAETTSSVGVLQVDFQGQWKSVAAARQPSAAGATQRPPPVARAAPRSRPATPCFVTCRPTWRTSWQSDATVIETQQHDCSARGWIGWRCFTRVVVRSCRDPYTCSPLHTSKRIHPFSLVAWVRGKRLVVPLHCTAPCLRGLVLAAIAQCQALLLCGANLEESNTILLQFLDLLQYLRELPCVPHTTAACRFAVSVAAQSNALGAKHLLRRCIRRQHLDRVREPWAPTQWY